jgi:two-component system NtrC family sensor kinase
MDTISALTLGVRDRLSDVQTTEEEIDIDHLREDIGNLIGESMEGTERIKKIVEDLKHFTHPGQDKVQDTDINRELESTLYVVNNELKYKASVIRDFNAVPTIQANPQQLNQVFVNIFVNAAQAIENKGEIRISTQQVNGSVEIRISDDGCGISPENISRIFDPFFTTKEIGKGTGLGMNIAYNIIKKHNGTIEVQSEIGNGTTFLIKLPTQTP